MTRRAASSPPAYLTEVPPLDAEPVAAGAGDVLADVAEWGRRRDAKAWAEPLPRDSDVALAEHVLTTWQRSRGQIVYSEGRTWEYDKGAWVWRAVSDRDLLGAVEALDGKPVRTSDPELPVRSVTLSEGRVQAVGRMIRRHVAEPEWFCGGDRGSGTAIFANGLAVTEGAVPSAPLSIMRADDTPTRARWTLQTELPWWEDAEAEAPTWDRFLADVLNPSASSDEAELLYEFLGAAMLGITHRLEKCLVLVGPGANGKSVILDVMAAMFPASALVSLAPHHFGRNFLVSALSGAAVNVCNEIPDSDMVGSEVFKRVVSGQPTTGEYKGKDAFAFRPRCAHIFAGNALPGTTDHSAGYFRRHVVVPLTRTIPEAQRDLRLAERIIEDELPAIALRAIRAVGRLLARGHYVEPVTSTEAMRQWRLDADVVAQWADECVTQCDAAEGWAGGEAYGHFADFARARGQAVPGLPKWAARCKALGFTQHRTPTARKWSFRRRLPTAGAW